MKKKLLVVIMAMCLLAAFVIGGTLAWLTSTPASITNTFTFGKVEITLTESTGTSYTLVPGDDIEKDPVVTVKEGSEACWVFVKVVETDTANVISFELDDSWTQLVDDETHPVANVYYKSQAKIADNGDATEDDVIIPVIKNNTVAVSDSATGVENAEIEITAYAIQSTGLASAYAAWDEANFS